MTDFPRPVVVVSRCLGFAACRWNGDMINDPFAAKLSDHVDMRPVCPECEIGLGVPRRPIRLVRPTKDDPLRLIQPATERDVTDEMNAFCDRFLDGLDAVDGFLLKYRSPSCGLSNVPIHKDCGKGSKVGTIAGVFGAAVKKRFPGVPAEDEGRLHNFQLREHFLIQIFSLARFREIRAGGQMKDLVRYHARMKYLLMAYSQVDLKAMGQVVANHEKRPVAEVFDAYAPLLRSALDAPAEYPARINALQHAYGHFSDDLAQGEKDYFLDLLEEYRRGGLPMSVPVSLLKAWAIRFDETYLLEQALLSPYPEALVEVTDSGKGRKY